MGISVLKIGGSTLANLSYEFYQGIVSQVAQGDQVIIVHGGGPAINKQLEALSIQSEFCEGLRKTTKEVLLVVEQVLCGQTNKEIVKKLKLAGAEAVGISGCDGSTLLAEEIDFEKWGHVGAISEVSTKLVNLIVTNQMIPVIAPIAINRAGDSLNVNADAAAAAIANAVSAEEFVYVTDVDGVFYQGEKLDTIDSEQAEQLIQDGVISGGMIPKVKGALSSLSHSLNKVRIMNGTGRYSKESGTIIMKKTEVSTS